MTTETFYYFGYGSNMDICSLRAKGVAPISSCRAILPGWRLRFNVAHYFRHEGGVGNVEVGKAEDYVWGVLHLCRTDDLPKLDLVEACGVGYRHEEVVVQEQSGEKKALTYVGMEDFIDDTCRPTQRYLNILLRGATNAGLPEDYIASLAAVEPCPPANTPEYSPDTSQLGWVERDRLSLTPHYTALYGWVFDMRGCRWQHRHLTGLLGGKDMTEWHLNRMDSSDGNDAQSALREGLSLSQRQYLNDYLNEYQLEYTLVGRLLV